MRESLSYVWFLLHENAHVRIVVGIACGATTRKTEGTNVVSFNGREQLHFRLYHLVSLRGARAPSRLCIRISRYLNPTIIHRGNMRYTCCNQIQIMTAITIFLVGL